MAGWARAAPGGTAGSSWGGERKGRAPLHSTSACSTASPVVFCPHPPSFSSLPQAPRNKADVLFGGDAHMWITWGDSDDPSRVERFSPNPALNPHTRSKPLPKKTQDPDAALFWLSHVSISHEYLNNLFEGKKTQRNETHVRVTADQSADYSNWGGRWFLSGFSNRETFHPVPSIESSWDW